jgi:hypothetical protein
MQTAKQYRHNAEVCLKLASETKEIYAKMALIDLATEFRALAEDLEHLPQSDGLQASLIERKKHHAAQTSYRTRRGHPGSGGYFDPR